MANVLLSINRFVWGIPALILILGAGIYLSLRTGFVQVIMLPKALRLFCRRFRKPAVEQDGVSGYQALCTALAATVGTGNIAGVAGAIAIGGPGAVFWMWVCAFIGMAIKYAEAVLSIVYRETLVNGETFAGPMYMISRGMGKRWKWLACIYSFLGVVASFGVGNVTQINAVISGINSVLESFGVAPSTTGNLILGTCMAVLIAAMLLGGAKKIARIAEKLVPFAAVCYLLLCTCVLIARFSSVANAFHMIFVGAFSPRAVTGGVLGSAFAALRIGASRGVFTNEAGLGTAGIAHGCASVNHSVEQGLMGIVEVFVDTIVICTMTALVILCSGIRIPFGIDTGAALTMDAFSAVLGPWVNIAISICLCLFAAATVLGWGLYGARCAQFLFGKDVWKKFVYFQTGMVVVGSVINTGTLWLLTETINGLMAIPNLIALVFLSSTLVTVTKEYRYLFGSLAVDGGTYENFNQCQPLRTFSYEKVSSPGGKSSKKRQEDLPLKYWPA